MLGGWGERRVAVARELTEDYAGDFSGFDFGSPRAFLGRGEGGVDTGSGGYGGRTDVDSPIAPRV